MILLLDNYDSFTYNVAQYLLQAGANDLVVKRNDEITVDEARLMKPRGIIISPGPCTPDKAGVSEVLIREFAGKTPIFGICLGMQAIGEVFGGRIVPAKRIMHGKESEITHDGKGVFESIPSPFKAIRYHSLAVESCSLPSCLTVSATAEEGEIMGLRHASFDVEGVQFHPESILTEHGHRLISNWLARLSE